MSCVLQCRAEKRDRSGYYFRIDRFRSHAPRPRVLLDWLPDAEALAASTRALKEYLGLWVYRYRGWA